MYMIYCYILCYILLPSNNRFNLHLQFLLYYLNVIYFILRRVYYILYFFVSYYNCEQFSKKYFQILAVKPSRGRMRPFLAAKYSVIVIISHSYLVCIYLCVYICIYVSTVHKAK